MQTRAALTSNHSNAKRYPARRSTATEPVVCLLSTHPLVLPELRRYVTPLKSKIICRRLEISNISDLHEVPLPVASTYIVDGHSFGSMTESLVAGIRYRYARRHVIVLVEELEKLHCFPLLRLGVKGLICYREAHSHLSRAVRMIEAGGIWVPRGFMSLYLEIGQTQLGRLRSTGLRALSRREREVLDFLLRNLSNKEIAASLNISESTVKFHVSNVISRFGVQRRADLILKCLPESTMTH